MANKMTTKQQEMVTAVIELGRSLFSIKKEIIMGEENFDNGDIFSEIVLFNHVIERINGEEITSEDLISFYNNLYMIRMEREFDVAGKRWSKNEDNFLNFYVSAFDGVRKKGDCYVDVATILNRSEGSVLQRYPKINKKDKVKPSENKKEIIKESDVEEVQAEETQTVTENDITEEISSEKTEEKTSNVKEFVKSQEETISDEIVEISEEEHYKEDVDSYIKGISHLEGTESFKSLSSLIGTLAEAEAMKKKFRKMELENHSLKSDKNHLKNSLQMAEKRLDEKNVQLLSIKRKFNEVKNLPAEEQLEELPTLLDFMDKVLNNQLCNSRKVTVDKNGIVLSVGELG